MGIYFRFVLALMTWTAFISVGSVKAQTVGYPVSAAVSGLLSGKTLVLNLKVNNAATYSLPRSSNGTVAFTPSLNTGDSYLVSVGVQPTGQLCSVIAPSGTVANNSVTVNVNCVPTYTVGGTVSGLVTGGTLVLKLNNTITKVLAINGPFAFATGLATGTSYIIGVGIQPVGQICSVTGGTSTVGTESINSVAVQCGAAYSIGGATPVGGISGLSSGACVTLQLNGGSNKVTCANGSFTFATKLPAGASYGVSVAIQPTGQFCTVSNASGTMPADQVTNVRIDCASTLVVSGTNASGASVSISGAAPVNVTPVTTAAFSFVVRLGDTISITASKEGSTCTVEGLINPVLITGSVSGVAVNCVASPVPYTVTGSNPDGATVSISGATPANSPITAATFAFNVHQGDQVTLSATKVGSTCLISNFASPATIASNVVGVSVNCTVNTSYSVGGAVMGLTSAELLTLVNNGTDTLTVTGPSGTSAFKSYVFNSAIPSGSSYSVVITAQPVGKVCFVFNPYSGTVDGGNVTNVLVTCSAVTYTVSGDVTGLGGGKTLTLFLNGGPTNSKTTTTGVSVNAAGTAVQVNGNTTFTFSTGLAPLATYEVTVGNQPDGQTCSIINASGTIIAPVNTPSAPSDPSSNISNVNVTCVDGSVLTASVLLGAPTANSIVIKLFSTDQKGTVSVSYGTASGSYPNVTSPIALIPGGISTEFNLGGLTADTQYYYKINFTPYGGSGIVQTPEYRFRTARNPGSSFSFVVQADPHWDKNTDPYLLRQTLQNMVADQPDFMLDMGDTFFTEKHNQAFDLTEGVTISGTTNVSTGAPPVSTEAQMIARYRFNRAYFGLATHSIPLFLVNGNHESEWGTGSKKSSGSDWAAKARLNYYANPKPTLQSFYSGYTTGSGEPSVRYDSATWYSWRWGDALFVVLDPYWMSSTAKFWGLTLGYPQYNWLRNTLASATNDGVKYKFIFLHNLVGGDSSMRGGIEVAHLYEWGGKNLDNTDGFATNRPASQGWTKPIHQLLVDNKVTAVFHGHDHVYVNQLHPDGIRYQELPQPGAKNTTNGASNATAGGYVSGTIKSSSGHVRVTVGPNGVTSEYVRAWVQPTSVGYSLTTNKEGSGKINKTVEDSWTCSYVPATGKCN